MRAVRIGALLIIATAILIAVAADALAPYDYATQLREHANEPPSRAFPLGTDELGRDRFSRLVYGTRVSLFCTPVAALLATAFASAVGFAGGYYGGLLDEFAGALTDLFLSLPWLFLLLTVRSALPLNVTPVASLVTTFLLLAVVGWAPGARIVRGSVMAIKEADYMLYARACGCSGWRLFRHHMIPSVFPVLSAQYWILIPVFLLTEANLGALGLGISEPLPSWGNMLAELRNYQRIPEAPWLLVPAAWLVLVVTSIHFVIGESSVLCCHC